MQAKSGMLSLTSTTWMTTVPVPLRGGEPENEEGGKERWRGKQQEEEKGRDGRREGEVERSRERWRERSIRAFFSKRRRREGGENGGN